MCRMLGVVAREPVSVRGILSDEPRSLASLSVVHRDGWGIARAGGESREWRIDKGVRCAAECDMFRRAADASARVVIAHVRQRTVGPTSLANTHPFQRGDWVFAHNGTVDDLAFLTKRSSSKRRAEVSGDTDSEQLFAYLMTAIDRAHSPREGVEAAARELGAARAVGAVNFLLSDGRELYAYRRGRSLFALDRAAAGRTGLGMAAAVASEPLTDEPWREIPEGTLIRLAAVSSGETTKSRRLPPVA